MKITVLFLYLHNVAHFLKARTVKPKKYSLLGNGCVTCNNRVTVRTGFFCVVLTDAIKRGLSAIVIKERMGKIGRGSQMGAWHQRTVGRNIILTLTYGTKWYGRWTAPFGGWLEYLHRSPASRMRRAEGNPLLWCITGPPCSLEI
jgi:hypothetical protein